MYNRFILACAKFQSDRLTRTEGQWSFQFLADFALLMAQNASFGNQGKKPGGKKSKVPFLIRNGSEKLEQVVFLMLMCTLQCLAHIDTYNSESISRYGALVVFFIYKVKEKVQVPPRNFTCN